MDNSDLLDRIERLRKTNSTLENLIYEAFDNLNASLSCTGYRVSKTEYTDILYSELRMSTASFRRIKNLMRLFKQVSTSTEDRFLNELLKHSKFIQGEIRNKSIELRNKLILE